MNPVAKKNGNGLIRTLVVDDAPLMRRAIQQILRNQDNIEIVGTATNGRECLDKIPSLNPDVITLDIDMPVMNGITTIKNIMVRHQIPIVIISSLVQDGYFAFESLRLGVVDFVPKPSRVGGESWADEEALVRMRVKVASGMQVHRMRRVRRTRRVQRPAPLGGANCPVVVIGTNLAGPNTIMHIVTQLPVDFPAAVVAVQEIHPRVLVPFCAYFNNISPLDVVPINGPTPLSPGRIFIGSTCSGVAIENSGAVSAPLAVRSTQPSENPIDRLFESAAHHLKENVCGILLTGIGTDGARGMSDIRSHGGLTIAQLQDCCVYPNLVENAIEQDVVDLVMSNAGIADRLKVWAVRSALAA
jgi:two-component system chemotaxis response regulator CheB